MNVDRWADMDIEEARLFIHNRFTDVEGGPSVWWRRDNEETFQELLSVMEPYMRLDLAVSVLSSAFWAAADEYGD